MAFLAAYAEAIAESSIFAHEGRHAIDRRLGIDADLEEREYRAKLSEVVFAPLPRLALRGILNPNIGSGTPHGRANRRIMQGLVSWIGRPSARDRRAGSGASAAPPTLAVDGPPAPGRVPVGAASAGGTETRRS